jgi:hypothetical protein
MEQQETKTYSTEGVRPEIPGVFLPVLKVELQQAEVQVSPEELDLEIGWIEKSVQNPEVLNAASSIVKTLHELGGKQAGRACLEKEKKDALRERLGGQTRDFLSRLDLISASELPFAEEEFVEELLKGQETLSEKGFLPKPRGRKRSIPRITRTVGGWVAGEIIRLGEQEEKELIARLKEEAARTGITPIRGGQRAFGRAFVIGTWAGLILTGVAIFGLKTIHEPVTGVDLPVERTVYDVPSAVLSQHKRLTKSEATAGGFGREKQEVMAEHFEKPEVERVLAFDNPQALTIFVADLPYDMAEGSRSIIEFEGKMANLQYPDKWTEKLKRKMIVFDQRVRDELLDFAKKQDPQVKNDAEAATWLAEWLRQRPGYSMLLDETEALESVYVAFKTKETIPDQKFEQINNVVKKLTGRGFLKSS